MNFARVLKQFLLQAQGDDLKTASYPKVWEDLHCRVSFGMGMPARIPWIAFVAPEMKVSRGFYPVYLYYKKQKVLILAYGVSETETSEGSWPVEVMNESATIEAFFRAPTARYGNSFVFKGYAVDTKGKNVILSRSEDGAAVSDVDLEADLKVLLEYYKKLVDKNVLTESSDFGQGIFYMEKELENFLIENWEKTALGKKYDLIVEEGELYSQQYKTDIGPIDILVREKGTGAFVVIELKKNQTSDDTVGQVARYMGWLMEHEAKGGQVKGVIIAARYDRRLDYALKVVPDVEVYLYEVDFKLKEFAK